jgi:ABC-type Na+ efflux pump permease subunit
LWRIPETLAESGVHACAGGEFSNHDFMTALPIVDRELRVASRRRSTYYSRSGAALIGLAVMLWAMMAMNRSAPQYLGKALFSSMSVVLFIYSFIAGIRVTSDSLSEEKREGTLGLLFLTDLRGVDIVFGKLVATSLRVFYGLIAVFPVLAVSLLLGGVTYGEFGRVVIVSMGLLLFSLSAGLLGSALAVDERKAFSLAFLIAAACVFVFPLVGWWWAERTRTSFAPGFWLPSPAAGCFLVDEMGYKRYPEWFASNVACTLVYSLLFFALACRIVPKSWQIRSESGRRVPWRDRLDNWVNGSAEARKSLRAQLLEVNPFCWLAGRERGKIIAVWLFLVACAAVWFWGYWRFTRDWLDVVNYSMTMFLVHLLFKIWFAGEASRRLAEDRQSGALELLLSTPLSPRDIVWGQWLALFRQFGGPLCAVLLADACFLVMGIVGTRFRSDHASFWVLLWGMFVITFLMDLAALASLGMWLGLTIQRVNRATSGACARVLSLPWILFALVMTVCGVLSLFSNDWLNEYAVVIIGGAISVANSLFFDLIARRRLIQDFRAVATMRGAVSRSARWFGLRPDVSRAGNSSASSGT